jgi:hypothetical protein
VPYSSFSAKKQENGKYYKISELKAATKALIQLSWVSTLQMIMARPASGQEVLAKAKEALARVLLPLQSPVSTAHDV